MANNGTGSHSYDNLVVIPYEGPVKKLALKNDAIGMKNLEFKISFDYGQLLTDESYNELLNDDEPYNDLLFDVFDGWQRKTISYRLINDVPFGLKVSVGGQ